MKTLLALLLLIPSLSWGLDKDELREELKYWKSLLDDNLISLEDYNQKKSELLSSKNDLEINVNPESLKSPEKTGNKSNDYELSLNEVKGIQLALKRLGWDISIDGKFGNQTQIALNDWLECNNLQSNNYNASDFIKSNKRASDDRYHEIVRDIDSDTPSRFNSDPRLLYDASGSAGKIAVFAVRLDTYKKPVKIIEAQVGSILKETDIVRFEDVYGRVN